MKQTSKNNFPWQKAEKNRSKLKENGWRTADSKLKKTLIGTHFTESL